MTHEISSLMDGELEPHEAERAIRSCCASGEARQKWQEYHLIGEVLRGGTPHPTRTAERVREALEQEPAIIAKPKPKLHESLIGRVAFAAAASVATVGVVGWMGSQGGPAAGPVPVVATKGAAPLAIQPVANTAPVPASAVEVQQYMAAHKQLPSAELYRPVNNRAPVAAAR